MFKHTHTHTHTHTPHSSPTVMAPTKLITKRQGTMWDRSLSLKEEGRQRKRERKTKRERKINDKPH